MADFVARLLPGCSLCAERAAESAPGCREPRADALRRTDTRHRRCESPSPWALRSGVTLERAAGAVRHAFDGVPITRVAEDRLRSLGAGSDCDAESAPSGQKQFQVPIWQRQYTWKGDQHEKIWRDLMEQYRLVTAGEANVSGHFLGSFVLSPKDPMAAGVSHFLVIDGQQRLTTLMLLLCALRDKLATTNEQAIERYDETYLINKY